MGSIKKNLAYNIVLALSGYVVPLFTFPYVTRILGVECLGVVNFAMSIVDYAILFANLGIAVIGMKVIAECADDRQKRSEAFRCLVSLHIVMTAIVLGIYLVCALFIQGMREYE